MIVPVRLLSNSEAQDFRDCRRKWWLRWVRRLTPDREEYVGTRSVGSRVHQAMAVYYECRAAVGEEEARAQAQEALDTGVRTDEARILGSENPDARLLKELGREHELCSIMIEGYWQWLEEEGEDDFIEYLAAEHQEHAPLGQVAGREWHAIDLLDAKVRDTRDGYVAHLDHKTTSAFGDLEPTLHISSQFKHYGLVDRINEGSGGPKADGTLVNMIRRVKRTANSKPPYYKRRRVDHSDEKLRSYFRELVAQAADMARAEDRLAAGEDHREVVYPTPTKNCYWSCDYFSECPLLDELEPGLALAGLVEKDPLAGRYDLDQLPS